MCTHRTGRAANALTDLVRKRSGLLAYRPGEYRRAERGGRR
jgi:hypothetical protein